MATMGHSEKEQIREDIELLQMTLQGTEDEFSPDEDSGDETGLIMDVEEGSIPEIGIGQRSNVTGTETPITIFSEDDTESQFSQERSVSMASTSQDEVQYIGPPVTEDSLAYDPETCLALNRAYQELVQNNLQKIEAVLAENRARQVAIHENMDIATRNAKEQKTEKKKFQLVSFHIPYIKDVNGACPPPNLDVQMKRAIEEPMIPNKRHKIFTKNERKKLIEAVQADNLQRWLRPLMTRVELQQGRLMRTDDPDEEAALKQQIQNTEREIERINSLPPIELAGTVEESDKVDWMKIATADFEGRTTSHLEQSWKISIHPRINWNSWTETEDKNLAEIVKVKNAVDWDEIARDLGTGRTAFQCIQRYQQRLNPNHCRRDPWSPEENEQLLDLVKYTEQLEGSVNNWAQIALAFDGRTERQCLTQYHRINPDQKYGRWTEEEDSKLLVGIRSFGPKKWNEIAKLVPGRNSVQCRERWYNSLSINLKLGEWTYQEDRAIILNHQKYKDQWSKIARCLPGRTDNQVMVRYQKMMKWADLAQKEDTLFQKTGINTKVPVGLKENRRQVLVPSVPKVIKQEAGYSLVQMAQQITDEQTENPSELELIRQDRANNLFIPRPPDSVIKFKILYRILERRRKVYDTLCNLFHDTDKKKKDKPKPKHDEKEIDSCTLKAYIEKRKDILSPALIKQLKEFIALGRPLKIREILTLSKKLKTARRSKSYANHKLEKEMVRIIHTQMPTIIRMGRPKKIWVEGASMSSEDEEQTRKKVSALLLKAFCLDPAQLLRRAALNRPGAVNAELLDLLKNCRPPPPQGSAEVVEIDSEVVDRETGSRTTEELGRRGADVDSPVAADEPGSGSNDGARGSQEVCDQGMESNDSTAVVGVSEEALVSQLTELQATSSATEDGASQEADVNSQGAVAARSEESADGGRSVAEDAGPTKDEQKQSCSQARSKSRARSKSGSKDPADVVKPVTEDDGPVEDEEKRTSRTRSKLPSRSNSQTKEPAESENLNAEDTNTICSKGKGKRGSNQTRSKSRSSSCTKKSADEELNRDDPRSSKDNAKRSSQQTRSKSRSRSNSGAGPVVENTGDMTGCQMSGPTPGADVVSSEEAPGAESCNSKGQSTGEKTSPSKAAPVVGKDGNIIGYTVLKDQKAQKETEAVNMRNVSEQISRQIQPNSQSGSVIQTEIAPDKETERVEKYPSSAAEEVVSGSVAQTELIPDKDTASGGLSQRYEKFVPYRSYVANRVVAPSYSKVISKELNIPRPVLLDETLEKKYPELLHRLRSPPVKQPHLFVKNEPPLKGKPEVYNIPPLPPTATTLFAFRSLLLDRRNLLETTTKFMRTEKAKARYQKAKRAKGQGQAISEGQIEGEASLGECAQREGLRPFGERLLAGYQQGVGDQLGNIGGQSAVQKEVGQAGDASSKLLEIDSVAEVKQEKSAVTEAKPMEVSSAEDVTIENIVSEPTQSNFAIQEDLALDNSLQSKITSEFGKDTSSAGSALDAFGVNAFSVVSVSTAEQDLVVCEAGEMNQTVKGGDKSNDNQANNDITDGDKDLGKSASSVSPVVVANDAGRQSVAIGDNVENIAVISPTEAGSNVTTEATIQDSRAGQHHEMLESAENTGCTGRPATMQEVSEFGRAGMEPRPGCSSDVTDGREVRQNMHQVTGEDDAIVNLKEVVTGLYGTHDYQMLRSRFLSLFVWPALLSATEVPETATTESASPPQPLTKSRRPFKKQAIKITEEGVKYKRRRYACTSGKRARSYNFQSKEQKADRLARNQEQGKRVTNLWRSKHMEIAKMFPEAEEGCSEYADGKQENGDADVKNGGTEVETGGAESGNGGSEVETGRAEEVENGEVEMEIEGANK